MGGTRQAARAERGVRAEGGDPEVPVPAGRPGAVERLFARLLPGLVGWAHGRLPQHARRRRDTWDLVQEACTGAITHLPDLDLRDPAQVDSYLRQSIKNRILDEIRRAGRVEVASTEEMAVADSRPTPLDDALESDDRRRFRLALLRLGEDDQQLVVGRIELALSYEQLARATGRDSVDAARCAARRAMLRLAREVGALERGGASPPPTSR